MNRTCDNCGLVDDERDMYYVTDDDGKTMCVCVFCAGTMDDATPVKEVENALGGKQNRKTT